MSQVNTKTVLLGSNADQSKNFKITVPTPEDGTLTIERADGTDVMKFLANGGVNMPTLSSLVTGSPGSKGHITLPNGLIINWGSVGITTTAANLWASADDTLSKAFPNAYLAGVVTPRNAVALSNQSFSTAIVNNDNATVSIGLLTGISAVVGASCIYIAIGY